MDPLGFGGLVLGQSIGEVGVEAFAELFYPDLVDVELELLLEIVEVLLLLWNKNISFK